MNRSISLYVHCAAAGIILVADRVTKLLAMTHCADRYEINEYLACEFTLNRGISWGMFHTENTLGFFVITSIIITLTGVIGYVTFTKWRAQQQYIGELLIYAGSVSNIIDRLQYGGVIDFIELSYKTWTWPIFNIADSCIVLGVGIMIITLKRQQ